MNFSKYKKQYFDVPIKQRDWVNNSIKNAPIWCSVDLRDGNQAIYSPLSIEEKVEYFKFLVSLGFKEIEVGFPASSDTEYEFVRKLIEDSLIPDDVSIQVLTQAREHIIEKTVASLKGAKSSIIHLYNSTSELQRRVVFKKSKEEVLELAVNGAKKLVEEVKKAGLENVTFEYSPESFTCTEPEYALDVCNAVLDVFMPTDKTKVIINLPSTIEVSTPNIYADQIEYINKNIKYRENVIISVHAHNDRGTAIASSELGLLAGADRIEGTVFGNGERTGNADIIVIALNMMCLGINPMLNIDNMDSIIEYYEKFIHIPINPRHPYAGSMAYVAFSGSHQDAISKAFDQYEKNKTQIWENPYLTIDPYDIGREYEPIKINSQSGKGGLGYIMEKKYGYVIPKEMLMEFSKLVTHLSEIKQDVLTPVEINTAFYDNYVNQASPLKLSDYTLSSVNKKTKLEAILNGQKVCALGNGPLDALCNALAAFSGKETGIYFYSEHALEKKSTSQAISYIAITYKDKIYWGAGIDSNINTSSLYALISAFNKTEKE